jgi:hypothetical protein
MPYTLKYNDTLGIIELVYSGPTSGSDLKRSTSEAILLARQSSTQKCLIDVSEMELKASISDLFGLPARQYEEEKLSKQSRIAILLHASHKATAAVSFFETACYNRGWQMQTFPERRQAVAWLTEDISK